MLYREAGQFKSTYAADQQIFPIRQDRIAVTLLLLVAFFGVPLFANEYWLSAILVPFLIFALAALGLNILTGYAGQLSLGTAAFMAFSLGLLHDSIWYARQWSTTIKLMFDGLIYALVLAGTFGWLWPKTP